MAKFTPVMKLKGYLNPPTNVCSVEVEFNTNFNYKISGNEFVDNSTSTNVTFFLEEFQDGLEMKDQLLCELKSILGKYSITEILNDRFSLSEWQSKHDDFLNKVFFLMKDDQNTPCNSIFVSDFGMSLHVNCHIRFHPQVVLTREEKDD